MQRARRRPDGVLLEKGALCHTGAGGRGPAAASRALFIQPRTDGPLCRTRGRRGVPREPLGLSKSESPILQHFVLLLFLSPGAKNVAQRPLGTWLGSW